MRVYLIDEGTHDATADTAVGGIAVVDDATGSVLSYETHVAPTDAHLCLAEEAVYTDAVDVAIVGYIYDGVVIPKAFCVKK